ncbi:MAG: TauD/TfdA dioxygenase family protein [Lautropia sp.]
MTIQIHPSGAPLGHEIRGADLSGPLSDADFAAIESAYDTCGVIVIRDQTLTPDRQIAFSRRFGPLDRYVLERYNLPSHPDIFVVSNVIENGRPIGLADAGRYWHTDMWVRPVPPRGSILYALEVPQRDGEPLGDTWFASMSAAYDALPESLRGRIEGREALYSARKNVEYRIANAPVDPKTGELSEEAKEGMRERLTNMTPEIVHPLVKRHPRTGRKCIYYSEGAIERIVGMDSAESDETLEALRRHVLEPRFAYRHRWRVGDVVMWDNVSCIHKAVGDFELPLRRRMHRTTLSALPVVE